jgi:formimidoylglutamase
MTKVYNLASIAGTPFLQPVEAPMHLKPVSHELLFKGRPGDPRLGEWVKPVAAPPNSQGPHPIVLFGNPDDLGVLRNLGRAGAKGGPHAIRRHLYKMTPPADWDWSERIALYDLGNTVATDSIRETHRRTRETAEAIAYQGGTVLALGGGNDFTAPGFSGFREGRRRSGAKGNLGIINVDPHLDARELTDGLPHSGTPYRELIENGIVSGKDVVEFGCRRNRNSQAHWRYCEGEGMRLVPFEALREAKSPIEPFLRELKQLERRCPHLGVSIDIDSCPDGEGSSAAPVLGLSAWELTRIAAAAGSSLQVGFFEIAEVAPGLDPAERTARIAAEIVYAFLEARARAVPAYRARTHRPAKPRRTQANAKR